MFPTPTLGLMGAMSGSDITAGAALALEFLNSTTLDSRITFSRGTNATLTDSNGRIAWAPHNLLTNSEDFEAAAWVKTNATVTANSTVAPDGITTADTLTTSGVASPQSVRQTIAQTGQVTFSVYAKAGTAQFLQLLNGADANCFANFNLSTGVIGTTGTGASSTISDAGSGWYRCTITYTLATSTNWQIYIAPSASAAYGQAFGATVANLFIWGAQLNIANAPVNLLTWSEDFTNATTWLMLGSAGGSRAANVTTAPDGLLTADSFSVGTGSGAWYIANYANQPIVNGQSYTFSVYLKANGCNFAFVRPHNNNGNFGASGFIVSLIDGTITYPSSPLLPATTGSAIAVGNGWWRVIAVSTANASAATTGGPGVWPCQTNTFSGTNGTNPANFTGDGTSGVFLWGAQLNTGSVALPYVATTSSINLPPAYNSTTPKNLLGFTQEPENAAWTKSNSYVQQNQLTSSQNFSGTGWVVDGIVLTADAGIAPDGSNTATSAVLGTGNNRVYQFDNSGILGNKVFSIYVKSNAGNTIDIAALGGMSPASTATVNTATGVVTGFAGASTVAAGNGWYRVSLPVNVTTASGNSTFWRITGPASSAFIWGAQLVQGSTAGDYTQTTSAAAPTRYLNWDGTLTGRKLVETTAAATSHSLLQSATVVSGVTYTWTTYLKAAERTFAAVYLSGPNQGIYVNLLTGAFAGNLIAAPVSYSIQNAGNGWWRVAVSAVATSTTLVPYVWMSDASPNYVYTGDGTSGIYVSDFQLSNSASIDPYVYNPQAAAASAAFYGPRFDYNPTGTPVLSGTELVTNGTFDSNLNGWTLSQTVTASLPVWSAGAMRLVSDGTGFSIADQSITTVANTTYSFTLTNTYPGSGTFDVRVGTAQGAQDLLASQNIASGGTLTYTFVATGTTSWIRIRTGSNNATGYLVDNVSVRAITGYTATANGLLIEEQRTNLLTYSEQFDNAAWAKASGASATPNTAVAPDGTTTADTLNTSAAGSYVGQTLTVNGSHVFSVYLKRLDNDWVIVGNNNSIDKNVWFNLSTGVRGTQLNATGEIQPVGNGWYRCSVTHTTTNANPSIFNIVSVAADNSGVRQGSVFAWGAQLEAGSFATSYIPTVASQVTRNADSASMLGDNFYTWFNQTAGTIIASFSYYSAVPASGNRGGVLGFGPGGYASANSLNIFQEGGTQNFAAYFTSTTYPDVNFSRPMNTAANAVNNVGFAYSQSANSYAATLNGQSPGTATSTQNAATFNSMFIGVRNSGNVYTNGYIRRIGYYNTRLPDSTLQALTT